MVGPLDFRRLPFSKAQVAFADAENKREFQGTLARHATLYQQGCMWGQEVLFAIIVPCCKLVRIRRVLFYFTTRLSRSCCE